MAHKAGIPKDVSKLTLGTSELTSSYCTGTSEDRKWHQINTQGRFCHIVNALPLILMFGSTTNLLFGDGCLWRLLLVFENANCQANIYRGSRKMRGYYLLPLLWWQKEASQKSFLLKASYIFVDGGKYKQIKEPFWKSMRWTSRGSAACTPSSWEDIHSWFQMMENQHLKTPL